MGLSVFSLALLKDYLPAKRILSLSYPDLVMSQDELESITGFRTFCENDSGKWHGRDHKLPETVEAFRKLGTDEFRCVDIVASRNVEEVADLNLPQDFGQYDMVLDPGTTEHVINVGQALVNAAHAVKVGGLIFHSPPLAMANHGFWSFNPTLFYDWYTQNGWKIEEMLIVGSDGMQAAPAPFTSRFVAPPESSLYCIARRFSDAPMQWVTQTKYLRSPKLK